MTTRPWTHELTELAALFLTVGAAHLLANLLGHQQHGAFLLVGAGLSLVLLSAAVRLWVHARRRSFPGGTPAEVTGGLWRIRTTVRDSPGELAGLAAVLGRRGVNILGVQLYPLGDGVADEFVVEAPPFLGAGELEKAVRSGHGTHPEITRAHVRDLADLPTRALRLAGRVVVSPDALPDALNELCGPCSVVTMPALPGRAPELDGTTLRLPDGHGRVLVLARPMSPFTPAEYARARALVELARWVALSRRPETARDRSPASDTSRD
jgi:hypothetical protein